MPKVITTPTNRFPVILLLLLLSSCASILNNPVQSILIGAEKKMNIISVDRATLIDSSYPNTSNIYYIARSSHPIIVKLQVDTSIKTVLIKPRNSAAYWLNVGENYGIGMLIDKNNPKRYAYPKYNYFTIKDAVIKKHRFGPVQKGAINLSLSTTFATIFKVNATGGKNESGGVLGFETGLDYFYSTNHYLSASVGAAINGLAMDYFGEDRQRTSIAFASIRNNHVLGSFDVGYGINVSKFKWSKSYNYDSTKAPESIKSTGLGLSFSAQYKFSNQFRIGVLYQPNILNTSFKPSFNYQHYISFNLIWKIPLKKRWKLK